LGLEKAPLDALPVHRIDEDGRGALQDQIGNVVLLLQAVPLGIQGDESIAVRLDDLFESVVQIDEEWIVHGLKRHAKQAALRFGLGAGLVACPAADRHYQQRHDCQTSIYVFLTPSIHLVCLLSWVPP
jgi:hypothetical protein